MKNTSILFKLSQESFANLDITHDEYKLIGLVFDLYLRQKNDRNIWAKTLWSELKPQLLLESMENYIKEFKQLPKKCHSLHVGLVLNKDMKNFKNSIPLFIALKNDAMKDEHWKKFMEQTG